MENKVITSIQFKRGTKENLEAILVGEKKPLKGEPIWELDTNRIKIGDGVSNYASLPYLAGGSSDVDYIVCPGYYDSELDIFWKETAKINPYPRMINKLYKDLGGGNLYYLGQDNHYATVFTIANPSTYGLVKLYNELGDNTDGSLTQKLASQELNKKCEISKIDLDDESITFKANL